MLRNKNTLSAALLGGGWGDNNQSTCTTTSSATHQHLSYWRRAATRHCSAVLQQRLWHCPARGWGESQPEERRRCTPSMDTASSAKSFASLSSTPTCAVLRMHLAIRHCSARDSLCSTGGINLSADIVARCQPMPQQRRVLLVAQWQTNLWGWCSAVLRCGVCPQKRNIGDGDDYRVAGEVLATSARILFICQ